MGVGTVAAQTVCADLLLELLARSLGIVLIEKDQLHRFPDPFGRDLRRNSLVPSIEIGRAHD